MNFADTDSVISLCQNTQKHVSWEADSVFIVDLNATIKRDVAYSQQII